MTGRATRISIIVVTTLVVAAMALASCQVPTTVLIGQVTNSATSNGIAGVTVTAYAGDSETLVTSVRTDATGHYSFESDQLVDGVYRLRFADDDWYTGASSWGAATPVTVTTGSPATADVALTDVAGSIAGTITENGGGGVSGAHVQAIDATTKAVVAETVTNGDGTYSIADLGPGDYLVRATAVGHARQYHSAASSNSGADIVQVAGSVDTSGVDIQLPEESTISISIDPAADEAPGVVAIALDAATGEVAGTSGISDGEGGSSGYLQITGLNTIGYHIILVDMDGNWAPQLYGSDTLELSTGTIVTPGDGGDALIGPMVLTGRACAAHHPDENLSGADLSGLGLANCDLHGANLTGANLSGANLHGANLTGADLTGVTVDGATDLNGTTLTGADLEGADLSPLSSLEGVVSGGITGTPTALPDWVKLVNGTLVGSGMVVAGADLHGADLSGLYLGNIDLTGVNLTGANLSGTNFAYSDLTGAQLDGATVSSTTTFAYATLTQVSLLGTDLSAMPASALDGVSSGGIVNGPDNVPSTWKAIAGYLVGPGANLAGADLAGTNLTEATLAGANFIGADLSGAVLTGLDLSGLRLDRVDFTGANLTNVTISSSTYLAGANCTSANLTGVDLSPASTNTLQGVRSGGITGGPQSLPTGWHLVDGYLIGAYANLSGANLTTSDLSGMDLSHTNLQDAALLGATVNGMRAIAITGVLASLPANWVAISFNYAANLVGPGADLSGAKLDNSDLSNVDLSGANLTGATLVYSVNLSGTNLLGATLTGVNTSPYAGGSGGVIGTPTNLPTGWVVANGYLVGPGAKVAFAHLANQDLTGVSLAGADVRAADFTDATGTPTGGSTALYQGTTCPDHFVTSGSGTCVGHGFAS